MTYSFPSFERPLAAITLPGEDADAGSSKLEARKERRTFGLRDSSFDLCDPQTAAEYIGRKPLPIWHMSYGPNITYRLCVADPNLCWTDLAYRQPLIVRCGYPPGYPLAPPDAIGEEGSISRAEFEELLEPLKHIRVPPCPGEEAFVCDGALYGFTAVVGSTSFSYQWHTIP